ncbi:methyltransferase domain-containing protein [Mycolicibacterium sp. XJ1819]
MTDRQALPLAERSDADLPGHWLLARLGKRVLRPGGLKLTTRMLGAAGVRGADVVELGPGLGRTARDIVALNPRSYVGVDDTAAATDAVRAVVAPVEGTVVVADAAQTGLPSASADVVIGEAMLTMQGDKAKRAIIAEAFRVLRPGGRYAIHELGLTPDSIGQETKDEIRRGMSRAIKVNARPLTAAEWTQLLVDAGFEVDTLDHAPMALLNPTRVLADEGLGGALRIVGNLISRPAARRRVIGMRRTFQKYRHSLTAVAVVGVVPSA